MTIRGILFDKDGTLVDFHDTWLPPYEQAARWLAAEAGRPEHASCLLQRGGFDAVSRRFVADSPLAAGTNRDIARAWASELGLVDDATLALRLERVFAQHMRPVAVPGLERLLPALIARGLSIGVATMDTEAQAHETLVAIGVDGLLGFVAGCDSGHGEKPEPGMVHAFAAHAGIAASDILVIGDSPRDLHMARAAGAGLAVGVLTGASSFESLSPLADHVLPSVVELLELLELLA